MSETWRNFYGGDKPPPNPCRYDGECKYQVISGMKYPDCFYGSDCHGVVSPCRRYKAVEE